MLEDHWEIVFPLGNGATHLEIPVEQIEGNGSVSQGYVVTFQLRIAFHFDPDDITGIIAADEFHDLVSFLYASSVDFGNHVPFSEPGLVGSRLRNNFGNAHASNAVTLSSQP